MDSQLLGQIHARLDKQDTALAEIKDAMLKHITVEETRDKEIKPALDELLALWKGTKVLSRILLGLGAIGAGLYSIFVWAKDHIK